MRLFSGAAYLVIMLVSLLCCRSQIDPAPQATLAGSMKGYELYSWREGERWYYSLLPGTNRIKSFAEISGEDVRLPDSEALMMELGRLPAGEWVYWTAQRVPGTGLPAAKILTQVMNYSEQNGLLLEIER